MLKHVTVTQEHIKKGEPEQGSNCPVYYAIEAVCSSVLHVSYEDVQYIGDDLDDETSTIESWLPPEVNARITAYDNNEGMEPFEFDLDIPDNVKCD